MRYYELTCLGEPSLLEEKVGVLIQQENGLLVNSYKKSRMISFSFQIEPENLANLEKKLKDDNQVARYMILSKKRESAKPFQGLERKSSEDRPKRKVELGEIEQKLEEILGQ